MSAPTTIDLSSVLLHYAEKACQGEVRSLAQMLPLLRFEQKPFTLRQHYQFEPFFQLKLPRRSVLMTARQVGKTHNVSASCLLRAIFRSNYHILLCEPLYAQMKQLSNVVLRGMIGDSYIRPLLQDGGCVNNINMRELRNGSRLHFVYCGGDATRVRGISGIFLCLWDEVADMEMDVINVVAETMSAVPLGGTYLFTGTPRFTDNTLAVLYEQSSKGVVHVRCGCGKVNIASPGHDLYRMIGKRTCICVKCGRPLDVRQSWYEFERPDRRGLFDGYHMSQVTHPLHATDEEKWYELLHKMELYGKAQFDNEVLGVPCDESVKLLTQKDLEEASHGRPNTLAAAMARRADYSSVVVGVDWGGGGKALESFTTMAVAGYKPIDGKVDILYMERVPVGKTAVEEAAMVLALSRAVRADAIAHDGTAAGKIREELLAQGGARAQFMVVPFWYVWAPKQDMLKYHPPQPGFSSYYSLDKTRSLALMVAAVQNKQVRLPEWKSAEHLLSDLLALGEDYREEKGVRQPMRIITRMGAKSDDMAHSVNFCAQAIWYMSKRMPDLVGV